MINTQLFDGYETLSDPEKRAFEQLSDLQNDSAWGLAIENVCKKPDVVRFRRLICQLKSQNADNSEVMKSILGPAYDAVIEL